MVKKVNTPSGMKTVSSGSRGRTGNASKVSLTGKAKIGASRAGYAFTSARAAALKKAQEASARVRRKGRAALSNAKFAFKDAVAGARAAVKSAKKSRAKGSSVSASAREAKRVYSMASNKRNLAMKRAIAKRPMSKGK